MVGFEADTLTQYLTYGLQQAEFRRGLPDAPSGRSALSAMHNKTDRNDARGIAKILRSSYTGDSSLTLRSRAY
jgi:hypothetical protein